MRVELVTFACIRLYAAIMVRRVSLCGLNQPQLGCSLSSKKDIMRQAISRELRVIICIVSISMCFSVIKVNASDLNFCEVFLKGVIFYFSFAHYRSERIRLYRIENATQLFSICLFLVKISTITIVHIHILLPK